MAELVGLVSLILTMHLAAFGLAVFIAVPVLASWVFLSAAATVTKR